MIGNVVKMVAFAMVASGATAQTDCRSCLENGDLMSCLSSCSSYVMDSSYIGTPEKRGLRALCMKNPHAAPCMNALRAKQNNNLFF